MARAILIAVVVLALAVVVKRQLEARAAAAVQKGTAGLGQDYYRDRALRTGLATAAWNPWGLVALGCSVGPARVKNSGACNTVTRTLVRVEDTVLNHLPIPYAKSIINGEAMIAGKAVRIVAPVASYAGVAAKDAASAVAHGIGSAAGAVGDAAGAVAGGVEDVAGAAWNNTLGRFL